MTTRTIVLTGASDGVGAAAARKLAARGDRLLLVGRSAQKIAAVAQPLGAEYFVTDFGRLDDVRQLAANILDRTDHIDVLANNAGNMFGHHAITVDGNERTMQVNHYAPFLLTSLLLGILRDSYTKVVNTSSIGGRMMGKLDMTDLDSSTRYRAMKTYGDSKLANMLFTQGLHDRYHRDGITAVAFHPGNIRSNLGNEAAGWMRALRAPAARLQSTPETGADNLIWAIDGIPGDTWQSGKYYESRKLPRRPNPQQTDRALTDAFWNESARRVGLNTRS